MKLLFPILITVLCLFFSTQAIATNDFPPGEGLDGAVPENVVSDTCPNLDLGPNANVCLGAVFTLNENPVPGQYQWFGAQGLSCTDCPSPTFTATSQGLFFIGCIVTSPMCSDTDFITINVASGLQPIITILRDTSLCAGGTISLGGPPFPSANYTWTSNPPGFSSMISAPSPVSPASSTTYYVSVTSATCIFPRRDSVVVKLFQPPVLSLISGTALCLGDSLVLGNTVVQPDVTYLWSPDDGSLSDIHLANPVAKPLSAGVHPYTVIATNPGCTTTGLVTIAVVDLTIGLSVPDTVSLCRGSSKEILVTVSPPGAMVTWSPVQQLQVSPNGLTGIVSPTVDFTYTIKATSSSCARSKTVFIHVDSLPLDLAVSPLDTNVCSGSVVMLSGSQFAFSDFPDISFQWTPPMGQLTPDNLPSLLVKPLETTKYQRVTNNGVCTDTAYATVTLIEPPVVFVSPAVSNICPGSSVILTATAAGIDSLFWSPAATLSCNECLSPTATPNDSTTYTVSGKFMGCPVSASAKVNVIPVPKYQFPPNDARCVGETIQLNLINDPSVTNYIWTSKPASAIPQVAQPTVTLGGSGVYSITYYLEANNGCTIRDSFKIQVTGATLMLTAPDTICPQTTKLLTAIASNTGGEFSWSNGSTTPTISVTPLQTTTYTVNYLFNGCVFQDSVQIVVEGQTPAILFPTDTELCPGETIELNSVETQGAMYSWTSDVGGFTSQMAIPGLQAPTETTTYTVTATALDGCSITKKLEVTVYKATLSVSDSIMVCAGVPFTISGTGSATGSYLWMPGNITTPTFKDTLNSEQTTHYALRYTYGSPNNECYLYDSVFVKVLRNFSVNIVSDPDSVLNVGDAVMLDAIVQPSQILNGFTFKWFENSTINVGNTEQITVTPMTEDNNIRYTVEVVSPNGCSQTVSISFRVVQPTVEYPTAFTPNGDGSNDVFRLVLTEGKVTVERLEIFNRWGNSVYESTEPDASWDGKTDGKDAPSDVYVFRYRWRRSDGSLGLKDGEVMLVR